MAMVDAKRGRAFICADNAVCPDRLQATYAGERDSRDANECSGRCRDVEKTLISTASDKVINEYSLIVSRSIWNIGCGLSLNCDGLT